MWLNLVAGWLALNAAVVTVATLARWFGPKRQPAAARSRRRQVQTSPVSQPLLTPRPTGRHPARHARHRPARDTSAGEPPSTGAPRSRTDL